MFLLMCAVIALAWASHVGSADKVEPKVAKWKYKATSLSRLAADDITKSLQDEADNGWELVSMVPLSFGNHLSVVATWKRASE